MTEQAPAAETVTPTDSALSHLQAKFAGRRVALIGVSLDSDVGELKQYASTHRLTWTQLHEPGGLDSRLANEMGILTLPTMILVDPAGRVVRRNIHVQQLEEEIGKLAE